MSRYQGWDAEAMKGDQSARSSGEDGLNSPWSSFTAINSSVNRWEAYMTPRSNIPQIIVTGRQHHPAVAEYLALGNDSETPSHFDKAQRGHANQGKRIQNKRSDAPTSGKRKAATSLESAAKQPRTSKNGHTVKVLSKSLDMVDDSPESTDNYNVPSSSCATSAADEPAAFSQGTLNKLKAFRYRQYDIPQANNPQEQAPASEMDASCPSGQGSITVPEELKAVNGELPVTLVTASSPRLPSNEFGVLSEAEVDNRRAANPHLKLPETMPWSDDIFDEFIPNDRDSGVPMSTERIPSSHGSDRTMGFTNRENSPPAMNTDSEDIFDCLDTLTPAELAHLEELCDSTQRDIDECNHQNNTDHVSNCGSRDDFDDFDDGLDDDELLAIAENELLAPRESGVDPQSHIFLHHHDTNSNSDFTPSNHHPTLSDEADDSTRPSRAPNQLRRLSKPFTPLTPQTTQRASHSTNHESGTNHQPIVRPPFPLAARDRSPIIGLSSERCLRTCFRVGEAINTGCGAVRNGKDVLIELYARVASSSREPDGVKQHFVFCDLFHDRKPFINGVFELWKGVELWDVDSSRFLKREKVMCRCIGKMKRDGKEWKMTILSIWEATWDDVSYAQGIVCV